MLKPLDPAVRIACLSLIRLFELDGVPADKKVTEGQLRIFAAIVFRFSKRVEIICSTQYGKTLWVALAAIIVACIQGEIIAIVAPTNEKAKLLMRYFIDHLGDDVLFHGKLEINTKLERLKQEESKERIILQNGGGIFVVSAQQRNAKKSIEAAMGQGAKIVVGDEFCLIEDNTEATIFRMIGGKGPDAFYCKIGNPFYIAPPNSHFKETWDNPTYEKIFIDYHVALAEGRYTPEFIEEAKKRPLFDILFACEFPPEDTIDSRGYRKLVLSDWIKYGITLERVQQLMAKEIEEKGKLTIKPKLGCDIGAGGDWNTYVLRWGKFMVLAGANQSSDTMTNVAEIERIVEENMIDWEDVNIDDIAVGKGVYDRLRERDRPVTGVTAGEPAGDSETFMNMKAELYWELRKWIMRDDVRMDERPEWTQLTWILYKVNSEKKVKIEPKEDLKKRTNKSPDYAEGAMLTFAERDFVGLV